MSPTGLTHRENLIERSHEVWRPPIFPAKSTAWDRWQAMARRFFDLQAASIWNDLRRLLPQCQGSVLDVGCGAQPYRSLLPASVHYTGIDTIDAQSRFGYQVPDTTYFEGDHWPVNSQSVDTVIATETLEHVERPELFLAEARRVLKPEGWLLLTVPFAARWHYIPHDYWRFTPSGLRTILTDSGFSEIIVYGRGNEITVACYKLMTLILILLMGDSRSLMVRWMMRFAGALLIPVMVLLAIVGQLSLYSRGAVDTLGYTVIASIQPATQSNG